jgi:hypothetical protein
VRRDPEIVRFILLWAEENLPSDLMICEPHFAQYPPKEIAYHLELLVEAGYVKAKNQVRAGFPIIPDRLTHRGHEYVDQIRDPEIWAKTKAGMSKVGGFSLELVGELAKGLVKTQIEKHTGVKL